jgi:hypothetical protein
VTNVRPRCDARHAENGVLGISSGYEVVMRLFDAILDFDAALDWPVDDEDLDLAYEPAEPPAVDCCSA